MKQFILVLCGLPSSGKSTLASAIQRALGENVEIVRTDDWRDDEYYTDWKPEKEGVVRLKALERARELVEGGRNVIHDDTNYYTSMRHELFEIAIDNKCRFAIIHVTTPLVLAIKWNNERTEGVIPETVIERISERFDQPGSRYSWDSPVFEVDMEHYEPDYVVPEIVEILDGLKPAKEPEHSPRTETQFEALDVETRRVVAEFLLQHPSLRNKEEVSVTRRDFLRKASEEQIPVRTVQKELWTELLKLL